jgi:hypothetical protein
MHALTVVVRRGEHVQRGVAALQDFPEWLR